MISEPLKPLVRLVSEVLMQPRREDTYIQCGPWRLEYADGNWFVYDAEETNLVAYSYWGKDLDAAIDKFLELINAN